MPNLLKADPERNEQRRRPKERLKPVPEPIDLARLYKMIYERTDMPDHVALARQGDMIRQPPWRMQDTIERLPICL